MLTIRRALKTNIITQPFGVSYACKRKKDGKVIRKKNGVCPAGYIDLYKSIGMKGHNGIDFASWNGEPLYFPAEADTEWTVKTHIDNYGGIGIDVLSKNKILNGKRVKLRFWHLKKVAVYDGQKVREGDLLGYQDNTGLSSGPHLHFGLKYIDEHGNTMNVNNGYYGGIDPAPYLRNEFVLDWLGVKAQALSAIQLANKVIGQVRNYIKYHKK